MQKINNAFTVTTNIILLKQQDCISDNVYRKILQLIIIIQLNEINYSEIQTV